MKGRPRKPSLFASTVPPLPPPPRRHHHHLAEPHTVNELGKEEERAGTSYTGRERGRALTSSSSRGKAAGAHRETIFSERNRRDKMNELYAVLQSMVPNIFHRTPRARIVDETINYIVELEEAIREMEAANKAKKKASVSSTAASSVAVTVSGKMAFFGIRTSVRQPGLAAQILQVFDKHDVEVLAATVACDGGENASGNQSMELSVTAMMDETAAERMEEELMAMLP